MHFSRYLFLLTLSAAFTACERAPREGPAGDAQGQQIAAAPEEQDTETVSILRPDIEVPQEEEAEPPLEPLNTMIGFPSGGSELTPAATEALGRIMDTRQMELGGPITLRAHTDSAGRDEVNVEVSEERGLAVAQWLIERGVEPERITVIAMGEQNPIEPNALPDGEPNIAGREANRRVEVEIALPADAKSAEADKAA